jgi:hypothetical protein
MFTHCSVMANTSPARPPHGPRPHPRPRRRLHLLQRADMLLFRLHVLMDGENLCLRPPGGGHTTHDAQLLLGAGRGGGHSSFPGRKIFYRTPRCGKTSLDYFGPSRDRVQIAVSLDRRPTDAMPQSHSIIRPTFAAEATPLSLCGATGRDSWPPAIVSRCVRRLG